MIEANGELYPGAVAARDPDAVAHVMGGSGEPVTYRALEERSCRLARALRSAGLESGDHMALLMENQARFFEVCWAALRSGLYCTPVSTALTPHEAAYIVADCGARAVVVSAALGDLAAGVVAKTQPEVSLAAGGDVAGCASYEGALAAEAPEPLDQEPEGSMMLYSSGTTGQPKGVKRPLSGKPVGSTNPLAPFLPHVGIDGSATYLSTAPLYHAAPLGWSLATQRLGGTVVVMERFDAAEALRLIEAHRVTHAQFVPTMFSRLLDLPEEERTRHDLSSLRKVIHAGAPCPLTVKRQMIEWLGPIVDEYYSGTEGSGITYITSQEWLEHPGSVGRPILGHVHVVDDQGAVLPPGTPGTVYFSSGGTYEYHHDPEATAQRQDQRGWTTLDDIGWLDHDGYLHLIDRKAHMIVSGGVNVSPTEVEDVLLDHPAVSDVAVIGVPNEEFGEEVKAVVVPAAGAGDGEGLPAELVSWCRQRLARYKCPRTVDLVDSLPRSDTGKLLKRVLREQYWAGHQTRIV